MFVYQNILQFPLGSHACHALGLLPVLDLVVLTTFPKHSFDFIHSENCAVRKQTYDRSASTVSDRALATLPDLQAIFIFYESYVSLKQYRKKFRFLFEGKFSKK